MDSKFDTTPYENFLTDFSLVTLAFHVLHRCKQALFYVAAGWSRKFNYVWTFCDNGMDKSLIACTSYEIKDAQGAVSAACSMLKKDIYEAVMKFVQCRTFHEDRTEHDDSPCNGFTEPSQAA